MELIKKQSGHHIDAGKLYLSALALFLIAFLFAPLFHVSADELLTNGSLESGTTGWLWINGQLSTTQEYVHGGQSAACFSSADADVKRFYQDVPIQPGSSYTFSGWAIKNSANIREVHLQIDFLSDNWAIIGTGRSDELRSDDPSYRFLTATDVAPSQAVSARLKAVLEPISTDPVVAYFDDLSLDGPTPSPTLTLSPSPTPTLIPSLTPTPSHSPTATATIFASTSAQKGDVLISEVMYNPAEGGAEWVELFNHSETTLDLIGWTISDNFGIDLIPSLNLPPGGFVLVAADQTAIPANFTGLAVLLTDGRFGNGLANTGDCVILRDGTGKVIDALSYGDDTSILNPSCPTVARGHSLERRSSSFDSDQATDFADNAQPSPGIAWSGPSLNPTPTSTPTQTPTPTPSPVPSLTPSPVVSPTPDASLSPSPTPELPSTLPQTGDPALWRIYIAVVLAGAILLSCGLWLRKRAG